MIQKMLGTPECTRVPGLIADTGTAEAKAGGNRKMISVVLMRFGLMGNLEMRVEIGAGGGRDLGVYVEGGGKCHTTGTDTGGAEVAE